MLNPHVYFEPRKRREVEEGQQPTSMTIREADAPLPSHATLAENIDRTIFFLRLANEQIRIVSPVTAEFIDFHHIKGLRQQFDFALTIKPRHDSAISLTTIDHLPSLQQKTSLAPAGLGGGVLDEMTSPAAATAPWNTTSTITATPNVPKHHSQTLLSELREDSEPLARARRYITQDLLEGSEPLNQERNPLKSSGPFHRPISRPRRGSSIPSRFNARGLSSSNRSTISEEALASSSQSPTSPPTTVLGVAKEAPASSRISYANIASVAKNSQAAPSNRTVERTKLSTSSSRHFLSSSRVEMYCNTGDTSKSIIIEDAYSTEPSVNVTVTPPTPAFTLEDYRALFITELPTNITLHKISQKIAGFGPLASIHLQTDVDETIPGRSACIIFLSDVSARTFFLANKDASDIVNHATFPWPPTIEPHNAGLFSRVAPDAYIIPAGPVQPSSENELAAMIHPIFARRRLKFTRSKLFHVIDIPQFKRDVLSILGIDKSNHVEEIARYVELWHFYNSGECTVVFASVKVARLVNATFRKWTRGQGEKGLGDKYQGVECAYAHDFNEEPGQKMWATFEWEVGCGPEAESQWVGRGAKGKGKVVYKQGASIIGTGSSMGSGKWRYKCRGQAACGLWEGPPAWDE